MSSRIAQHFATTLPSGGAPAAAALGALATASLSSTSYCNACDLAAALRSIRRG
jgi:hypothetical protein|eukprot:COSAG06_NODE_10529_length_1664_cov_27.628754_3_plen_53_part_01